LPNRSFILSGTSAGGKNSDCLRMAQRSIFNENISWTVYFHDISTTALMFQHVNYLGDPNKYAHFQLFDEAAKTNKLPQLSFIEPRYLNWNAHIANDQHPPHSVTEGERLIAQIYNSLYVDRSHNNNVALLIAYDEHGGLYDHKNPPWLPKQHRHYPTHDPYMAFCRYGARVPVVLVSPYLEPQIVEQQMDHCSIPHTIAKVFKFDLGNVSRVNAAHNFLGGLNWTSNLSVKRIEVPLSKPIPQDLRDENYYFPRSWMKSAFETVKFLIAAVVNPPIKGMNNDDDEEEFKDFHTKWAELLIANNRTDLVEK